MLQAWDKLISLVTTALSTVFGVTVKDSTGDSAMDDTNNAVRVTIVSGSSAGTEYTEGDTDASITGTAFLWEDSLNTLRPVSATKPLPTAIVPGGVPYEEDTGSSPYYTEDLTMSDNGMGIRVLGKRRDADTSPVSTSGDAHDFLFDALGNLKVRAVTGGSATGTITAVGDSALTTTLLAANSNRRGASIYNDSSAKLYVKLGATASTSSFTVVLDGNSTGIGGYYEVPSGYTGIIDGIWASDAGGNALVSEVTA